MQKLDKSLKNEIIYLFCNTVLMSVVMQAVFLIIGKWDYTVLLGNVYGAVAVMTYYILLAYTVDSALKKNENDAKGYIKLSQSLRLIILFAIAAVGVWLEPFHPLAVVIPLLFPRISLIYRPLFNKKMDSMAQPKENDDEKIQ